MRCCCSPEAVLLSRNRMCSVFIRQENMKRISIRQNKQKEG